MYVYELSQELKLRSRGGYTIAVLYPVLYKLEEQGFVEVAKTEIESNRVQSYYGITQAGQEHYGFIASSLSNVLRAHWFISIMFCFSLNRIIRSLIVSIVLAKSAVLILKSRNL